MFTINISVYWLRFVLLYGWLLLYVAHIETYTPGQTQCMLPILAEVQTTMWLLLAIILVCNAKAEQMCKICIAFEGTHSQSGRGGVQLPVMYPKQWLKKTLSRRDSTAKFPFFCAPGGAPLLSVPIIVAHGVFSAPLRLSRTV